MNDDSWQYPDPAHFSAATFAAAFAKLQEAIAAAAKAQPMTATEVFHLARDNAFVFERAPLQRHRSRQRRCSRVSARPPRHA